MELLRSPPDISPALNFDCTPNNMSCVIRDVLVSPYPHAVHSLSLSLPGCAKTPPRRPCSTCTSLYALQDQHNHLAQGIDLPQHTTDWTDEYALHPPHSPPVSPLLGVFLQEGRSVQIDSRKRSLEVKICRRVVAIPLRTWTEPNRLPCNVLVTVVLGYW